MSCPSWIKQVPVLIHLKYWYYNLPYPEFSCLPHHFCLNLPLPTETPLQNNPYRFPYFVPTHSTTCHHKYWIYQTIWQVKSIKFIIKLYLDDNNLWAKQKAESLRTGSPSKLDNTVNNNSIFNTKYAKFSAKW